LIERAAHVDSTVLITGESGVGKELVARDVHRLSARRRFPFIPVNCAALPDTLIENELFGHEPGAYTDAKSIHRGAFELADGGTLFLDEVGEFSLAAQPKLLRALEAAEIVRVGGERSRKIDLRIIAATNHRLKLMCKQKSFRVDLFYRLNVLSIHVPPLRKRPNDIPILAKHFATTLGGQIGRSRVAIDPQVMDHLVAYHWPGNVRELRSVVERALALSSGERLDLNSFELDPVSIPGVNGIDLMEQEWRSAREGFEAAYARRLLRKYDGNVKTAARAAGLAPGSLYKMLRRLGIRPGPS
jgi:transcriptional regulator with GAF, ATPase, and Fis domain